MAKSPKYLLVLFLILLIIDTSLVRAEDNIGIFRVALVEHDGIKNQEYGKPIILSYRDSHPVKEKFHARLFRGEVAGLKSYLPDAQGCVRFNTITLKVSVTSVIKMQGPDDPAWLKPDGDGFKSEEYTIVFESGEQPTDSVIRIHQSELDKYFKNAISINVISPEHLRRAVENKVKIAESYLQSRREDFQKITASVCWGVKVMTEAPLPNETTKVAELTECANSWGPLFEEGEPLDVITSIGRSVVNSDGVEGGDSLFLRIE